MPKRLFWIGLAVVAIAASVYWLRPHAGSEHFTQLVSRGNGRLEKGDASDAIALYSEALQLSPESADVRLNLANADLLAERNAEAAEQCRQTLALDHNSAAAYYLLGVASLRQNQWEAAVQAFQQSWKIDHAVPALDFQMGLAQAHLGQLNDAIRDFEGVIRVEPNHPSAHYQLSRVYQQAGRDEDAARALQEHQKILAKFPSVPSDQMALEKCKYTQPLAPFVLEQPARKGNNVHFVEASATAFGSGATRYHGPLAVIDYDHSGRNSLFAGEGKGFRLLDNHEGHFAPLGPALPGKEGASYRRCLVGDLDNDGFDDVVVLGEDDSRVFKFYAQGQIRDATLTAGLQDLKAHDGLLADLDFTGNLDLVTIPSKGTGLAVFRNLGNFFFDSSANDSGLPTQTPKIERVISEDWNHEGLPGIFVSGAGEAPMFYAKKRAAAFVLTGGTTDRWPIGTVMATGDFNNDLQPEAVIANGDALQIIFKNHQAGDRLPLRGLHLRNVLPVDYDNDGWLDLLAYGDNGVRLWRNRGHSGFEDTTKEVGLDHIAAADAVVAADFDHDGDTDLVVSSPDGLHFWRNDGGNANSQLKLRLVGKRSNASALGVNVEVMAGSWRTSRTVQQPGLEIGVGRHEKLDALKVHWFDLSTAQVDLPVTPAPITLQEPSLPSGSCPNLYAWDGQRFKFVTDILGAAPLGLPLSATRLLAADPEEFLNLGDEDHFPARNGAFELRVTEELREVLYLDQASLVIVDHAPGTVVYPTSKLHAGPPFPPHELWTLHPIGTPRKAIRDDGLDVTAALAEIDGQMVSPMRLRSAQQRGLAEPYSVTMDFDSLSPEHPIVLALTGWLRFGGGMANINASLDPKLPFPFPVLEAQLPDGSWKKIDADVGAPAGKTKTILVDLENKLPPNVHRLRLSTAFEIYWDRVLLCEKTPARESQFSRLAPTHTDLHWRGFSRYADLPPSLPLTPKYDDVRATPPWDHTPTGWCTRYGEVNALIETRDDKLVLLNGGDELALSFDASQLPPKPPGLTRDFFLHVFGWDKDADFHVAHGWEVEPLPFRGMDDQAYGRETRHPTSDESWIKTYNTRWVGSNVVSPAAKSQTIP